MNSESRLATRVTDAPRRRRVLVVLGPGRGGERALHQACELSARGADLSVVSLAPQADPSRCCGPGPGPYNCAVREEAADELRAAREMLGAHGARADYRTLIGTPAPPLARWAAARDFDLVLIPGHRTTLRGGREARTLRRVTGAEIRIT